LKGTSTRNCFALEALEPRVLLNAHVPDVGSVAPEGPAHEAALTVAVTPGGELDQASEFAGPTMQESIDSIFAGVDATNLLSGSEADASASDASGASQPAASNSSFEEVQKTLDASPNLAASNGPTSIDPERPMVFIPGFGGSFAADDALGDWMTNRGLHPDKLQLDPLGNTYTDLINTLISAGYALGSNLFVANWDWRLAVAPADGTVDGVVNGVSASSLVDETFTYGVDYLGWTLSLAVSTWKAGHNNVAPAGVDIVTHSTGGLVARSYIQSAAYNQSYGEGALPEVNNLYMLGVPNQGVATTWALLNDNWAEKPSTRALGIMTGLSYEYVLDGGTIEGADGDINLASISTNGTPDKLGFIAQYAKSNRDLLATFDFIDADQNASTVGALSGLNGTSDENKLLLDLNQGLGLDAGLPQNSDPTQFVDLISGQLHIIYASDHATPGSMELYTGNGSSGSVTGMVSPAGRVPADGEQYYIPILGSNNGDGTVTTMSSWDMFSGIGASNPARAQKVFGHQIAGGSDPLEHSDHSSLASNQDALEIIL
jgi:triacylglycerol esterase/lipase EstA (alpha/beta hydrolase family)